MDPGDGELLESCRRGSAPAREAFVRRYEGLVRWAVSKTLGEQSACTAESSDIFQDVFRRVFEPGTLEAVRDDGALKTWLVVVSCRVALDACRKNMRQRGRELPLEDLEPSEGPDSSSVAQDVPGEPLSEEQSRVVRDAVEGLRERERACVRFHYLEGLTHKKIGEVMGLPKGTVSTILRRARGTLRKKLRSCGYN